MATETGEYVVGAYLKICMQCDVVDCNARPMAGGAGGLSEVDVVGRRFADQTAFLCEVSTHLDGLLYGQGNDTTAQTIRDKIDRQRRYAGGYLRAFTRHHFMLWSPVVPTGPLTAGSAAIDELELVINREYARRVGELRQVAGQRNGMLGTRFFRALQISNICVTNNRIANVPTVA